LLAQNQRVIRPQVVVIQPPAPGRLVTIAAKAAYSAITGLLWEEILGEASRKYSHPKSIRKSRRLCRRKTGH